MIYTKHNRYFTVGQDVSKITLEVIDQSVIRLPIYVYVHGGVRVKAVEENPFSCSWGSGQCGVAVATRKDILVLCGGKNITKHKIQTMKDYLIGLVEDWNEYINHDEHCLEAQDLLLIVNQV